MITTLKVKKGNITKPGANPAGVLPPKFLPGPPKGFHPPDLPGTMKPIPPAKSGSGPKPIPNTKNPSGRSAGTYRRFKGQTYS